MKGRLKRCRNCRSAFLAINLFFNACSFPRQPQCFAARCDLRVVSLSFPGSMSLALSWQTNSSDPWQRACRVAQAFKMIGKTDLTGNMGMCGLPKDRSCGIAGEAFCNQWG